MGSDASAYFLGTISDQHKDGIATSVSPSAAQTTLEKRPGIVGSEDDRTDEILLAEAGNGSKEAIGSLFRRHRRAVLNVASRILRDLPEAEDLCQEVFLLLFQKAKFFDASKGSASSWIIQIAYHRAINRRQYLTFRRHYDTRELDEQHLSSDPCRVVVDEIVARTLLNRIREHLAPEQQQTLELHFFEGYSLREIADQTGQTLGNIRHHYYRGLERLRSCVFPKKGI
jgi:RNA polymerase sigma-70 factor, ECF subfamily